MQQHDDDDAAENGWPSPSTFLFLPSSSAIVRPSYKSQKKI
jgi:hypothetical protein